MNDYKRIAKENDLVKIETIQGETFIGTISSIHCIILDNGEYTSEIYLSQHPLHKGKEYGTVCLSMKDVRSVKVINKVYISNITSDIVKTDGRDEITSLNLHELICDRQIEGSIIEKRVISILDSVEYESVQTNGYYLV